MDVEHARTASTIQLVKLSIDYYIVSRTHKQTPHKKWSVGQARPKYHTACKCYLQYTTLNRPNSQLTYSYHTHQFCKMCFVRHRSIPWAYVSALADNIYPSRLLSGAVWGVTLSPLGHFFSATQGHSGDRRPLLCSLKLLQHDF